MGGPELFVTVLRKTLLLFTDRRILHEGRRSSKGDPGYYKTMGLTREVYIGRGCCSGCVVLRLEVCGQLAQMSKWHSGDKMNVRWSFQS